VYRRFRSTRRPGFLRAMVLLSASPFVAGCGDDGTGPDASATFTVEVSGEEFTVRVEGFQNVQGLQERLAPGREGVISGELIAGDGGFNAPWSWHLDPATVHAPDLAIELCDGRPSMVEEDLDYWLESVGTFCPWGAKVVGRVE